MTSVDLTPFYAAGRRRGTRCNVAMVLDGLDAERANALRAALVQRDISGGAIERVAKSWGVALAYNSIRRHRAGQCNCG